MADMAVWDPHSEQMTIIKYIFQNLTFIPKETKNDEISAPEAKKTYK